MTSRLLKLSASFICMLTLSFAIAQNKTQNKNQIKFGKIAPEDFNLSKHHFDTSVNAVVMADIGLSSFEGNSKGWFTLYFRRQKRVKILNRNGFDAANESIVLYSKDGGVEKLENLKASTFNLEDGKIVETKLENTGLFSEKISANLVRKKFTLPAVKEGSIIEFSYTISSDFLFNLQSWTFQGPYPCLWSDYQVDLPEFFNYVSMAQGYIPYYINTVSNSYKSYHVLQHGTSMTESTQHLSISGNVTSTRWVIKEVPAIKEEAFTSSLSNHTSKLAFQLSQYRFPNTPVQEVMGNWKTASEALLNDEDFGVPIDKDNFWLNDDMRSILNGTKKPLEKAQKIYAFVRDNFTCTDFNDIMLNNNLKTIFKNKNGSVSDINLLLVSMLRHEHIAADPLLLSTRDHGVVNELYPLMQQFNYVIASAKIDDMVYYLDATHPLGFGKLAGDCYNGAARIINKEPLVVYFDADSLTEQKFTNVIIINNDKGLMDGSFKSLLGFIESSDTRKKVNKNGKETFYNRIKTGYGSDFQISNMGIDSLKLLEEPVAIRYDFLLNSANEDIIYFNPLMSEGYKENLFKSAVRNYPVEMPYAIHETYVLTMEIPQGYEIDEVPKSARVDYNGGEGYFEYMIGKTGSGIQLRSRVMLQKANFEPEDYKTLREFFGYIVKKHSEQIVLKKIK